MTRGLPSAFQQQPRAGYQGQRHDREAQSDGPTEGAPSLHSRGLIGPNRSSQQVCPLSSGVSIVIMRSLAGPVTIRHPSRAGDEWPIKMTCVERIYFRLCTVVFNGILISRGYGRRRMAERDA